ncbi:hypothetical protein BJY52DRAFT_1364774 [Lactarius psammicola]|nr:hypothetical protein BJY52DRAFT_1364774 [Lactarius psammicola]
MRRVPVHGRLLLLLLGDVGLAGKCHQAPDKRKVAKAQEGRKKIVMGCMTVRIDLWVNSATSMNIDQENDETAPKNLRGGPLLIDRIGNKTLQETADATIESGISCQTLIFLEYNRFCPKTGKRGVRTFRIESFPLVHSRLQLNSGVRVAVELPTRPKPHQLAATLGVL